MADQTTSTMTVRGCNVGLMRGGTGRPLVILHGASGAGTWLPFMRSLADMYDVIVPEHPGFGTSDTPDWLDNIHDLAYFYLDILDQLDLDGIHLVGVSLGGWIAAELAIRSTQRLSSLTLVDAAGIHVPGIEQIDTFPVTAEINRHHVAATKREDRANALIFERSRDRLSTNHHLLRHSITSRVV